MASAHRSGNSSPPRASRGDRDVRTTCLFCSKGKTCSIAGGHWAGIWMAAAAPSWPAAPPGQGSGLTPVFLSPQAPLHRSRAQLPATMLLLLLGILFLHIAVLVLLFVSTIVSVSAGRAGQGRLPAGRQLSLLWVPSQLPNWNDICRQLDIPEAPGLLLLHFFATGFFSVL